MKRGFSLVELSIVLVILGLLVGGVLSGQALIRAAEIKGTLSSISKYSAAALTFRDKYFALPGDMPNATSFWGASPDCYTGSTTLITTTTCNGNGDGRVGYSNGLDYSSTTTHDSTDAFYEEQMFYQHMALAGLIEGSYRFCPNYANSATCGGSLSMLPGSTVGTVKMNHLALGVTSNEGGVQWYKPAGFSLTSANWFYLASQGQVLPNNGSYCGYGQCPGPSVQDAWNIDTKIDDGKPGTGSVIAFQYDSDCYSGTDPATVYDLQSGNNCDMYIKTGF